MIMRFPFEFFKICPKRSARFLSTFHESTSTQGNTRNQGWPDIFMARKFGFLYPTVYPNGYRI